MTFGRLRQMIPILKVRIGRQLGFMRMNPDRRIDEFILLRDLDRAIERPRTITGADCHNIRNPGVPRPRQNSRQSERSVARRDGMGINQT